LTGADPLYLRTARHPAVADLPAEVTWESFDGIYDRADSFDAVYAQIVRTLLDAAAETTVVYAVPGHPLMGESTVTRLLAAAERSGIAVEIVAGLSFCGAVFDGRWSGRHGRGANLRRDRRCRQIVPAA
jgi:tetrapyrrole methylase family protein/MazG family protein